MAGAGSGLARPVARLHRVAAEDLKGDSTKPARPLAGRAEATVLFVDPAGTSKTAPRQATGRGSPQRPGPGGAVWVNVFPIRACDRVVTSLRIVMSAPGRDNTVVALNFQAGQIGVEKTPAMAFRTNPSHQRRLHIIT